MGFAHSARFFFFLQADRLKLPHLVVSSKDMDGWSVSLMVLLSICRARKEALRGSLEIALQQRGYPIGVASGNSLEVVLGMLHGKSFLCALLSCFFGEGVVTVKTVKKLIRCGWNPRPYFQYLFIGPKSGWIVRRDVCAPLETDVARKPRTQGSPDGGNYCPTSLGLWVHGHRFKDICLSISASNI